MKTLLLTSFAIFASCLIRSQTTTSLGKKYVFTVSTAIYESDFTGKPVNQLYQIVPVGSRFEIINETDTTFIIQFPQWVLPTDSIENKSYYSSQLNKIKTFNYTSAGVSTLLSNQTPTSTQMKYFIVYKLNLEKRCISIDDYKIVSTVSGAMFFPFKLRTQTGEFTTDITLNGMSGLSFKLFQNPDHKINVLLGVGISSVTLDSLNTKGKVKESSDRAAVTPTIGLVYQYKQIQFAIAFGGDYLNKRTEDNWIYNRKSWIGVGFGLNIFKQSDGKEDKPSKEEQK